MKEFIQFENLNVEIWRRPRQRRMYLTVRDDGRVRVTCNRSLPRRSILSFIADNREFIAGRAPPPPKQFLSGDTLLHFGRQMRLNVVWTWDQNFRVVATGDEIELTAPIGCHVGDRARAVAAFFRRQGRNHLIARVNELSARTNLRPAAVSIRGQQSRWGSCSALGRINLNWKLAAAPPAVIDYVILHELSHLEHLNHSPQFWGLVERLDPDWRRSSAWLTEHSRQIGAQFATSRDFAR